MRKLSASIILFFCLLLSLTACSSGKPDTDDVPAQYQIKLSASGVTLALPEELRNLKGVLYPYYSDELLQGSGCYYTSILYAAMPSNVFYNTITRDDLTNEEKKYLNERVITYFEVFAISGNRGQDELGKFLAQYGVSADGFEELGKKGEYTFFLNRLADGDEGYAWMVFDEGYKEEFDNVLVPALNDPSWIRTYEPNPDASKEGDAVIFEAYDLEGNSVKSEDIFSQNVLTMVNIWGTYCSPCIREMPELEKLNERLAKKNCGIIGIVCDIRNLNDAVHIDQANEIIEATGVTYMNLIPWPTLDIVLPSQFVPTTYFVDSNGCIVGEMLVGARGADDYEKSINAILETLAK
ncbi:MAG: TlpA family protein disulfide reductase [Erysipelotrichaceae bacterium]|nr:TlpA family protein disulfide reductase [Erysipelotrichaceae bacterium]